MVFFKPSACHLWGPFFIFSFLLRRGSTRFCIDESCGLKEIGSDKYCCLVRDPFFFFVPRNLNFREGSAAGVCGNENLIKFSSNGQFMSGTTRKDRKNFLIIRIIHEKVGIIGPFISIILLT